MGRATWSVVFAGLVVFAGGSVLAQDPCAAAAMHLAECGAQFCPLLGGDPACAEALAQQAAALSANGGCAVEAAAAVERSTCAALAASAGVATSVGDVCERAVGHMISCCAGQTTPLCAGINQAAEAGAAALGPCDALAADMSETILAASCESIRDGSFMTAE